MYDRVADRLYKIRNCLNISGEREQLALFAPPLDVMSLVRASAARLSLDAALAFLDTPVPPYRFTYLIERARQAAQTVDSFGTALLSALEKKDVEELTLLRSLHERVVLQMTTAVKTSQVTESEQQLQALVENETNVQIRIEHYKALISGGLSSWETTQELSQAAATELKVEASVLHVLASVLYLIPNVGDPFAMTFGGRELGASTNSIGTEMLAIAGTLESIATAAGLEGGWQRREEEWLHQLSLAQQELLAVRQQLLAAETRAEIAKRELKIHETTIDQAAELDTFYKQKFTSLGLYNYLATSLTGLHRQAYSTADGLARAAQRAYAFERDDDTEFIAPDNWQAEKNGLLAGQRLTLQLEQMEAAYLRSNTRTLEISQAFSLLLLDPQALLTLRETGSCEFGIPEIMFDIAYPGQYKRIVKSVRLTIPAVVGPYTSVSAKLTLTASKVRVAASADSHQLVTVPPPPTTSIATSSAVNDAGVFELSFRDERYLPFEGAGAVSSWKLTLPDQLRAFDYTKIPDVSLHLSYTALDDDAFRDTVETSIVQELTTYASTTGLRRLFSVRHEFPEAFQQLLHPTSSTETTKITLAQWHFPYFLSTRKLTVTGATILLQPAGPDPLDTTGLTISLNGVQGGAWSTPANTNLGAADFAVAGPAEAAWTLTVASGQLDPTLVADLLVMLKYTVS
jgi:hypothetical protein